MTFVSVLLISCLSAASSIESSQGNAINNPLFTISRGNNDPLSVSLDMKWVDGPAVCTEATRMYRQETNPLFRSSILHYKYLQTEESPTMNLKNKDNRGVFHRWIIPCMITIGAGAVVLTLYSVRGR